MAQKRMFDKAITNSDNFLELPDSSQILYFHLSMNADDDGFVDNWKSIIRMTGTKEDDLKILIAKSYVIPFETGVIVIKHWRMNNYLRQDRYKETTHKLEKSLLSLGENEEYLLANNSPGIPMVNPDKNSIDKNRKEKNIFIAPTIEEIKEYCISRNNNVDPERFFDYYETNGWKDKDNKQIKNWKQKVITWEGRTPNKQEEILPNWFDKDIPKKQISKEEQEELEKLIKEF